MTLLLTAATVVAVALLLRVMRSILRTAAIRTEVRANLYR